MHLEQYVFRLTVALRWLYFILKREGAIVLPTSTSLFLRCGYVMRLICMLRSLNKDEPIRILWT